ncbi:MAG: MFS transporter [Acidobacteria bacterium]|nr:MFS transporter [Acidobacteriota bacterium]
MKYYQKLTLLFCLMFGFIGIQRVVIAVIMPTIKADLGFSYTQQGMIVAITGLTWALGTIIFATIGDRYGRRPIIVLCTILSGVFSWITGFVHNVGQLIAVRGFLGFFEGGPYPLSMGTISEEAPPHRRALNAGLVTGSFMLIGICVGSVAAGWLVEEFGSWRPVFYVVSIPAILVGILLAFMMREAPSVAEAIRLRKEGRKVEKAEADRVKVWDALKYKNVLVSSINSVPVMGWLYIFTTFSSSFLFEVHGFNPWNYTVVIATAGLGGFLGESILGSVSDMIGRKKALILTALLCSGVGITIAVMAIGTSTVTFCVLFFFYGFFGGGMYPMYLSTLPAESVPPRISGTAVAIPTGIGETLGAALMPTIAGMLSDMFNLYAPMWMAALAGVFIAVLSLFYVETAPRCVEKMKHKPTQEDHLLKPFRPKQTVTAGQ